MNANRNGQLGILGAGSWGTALAIVLATRFEKVLLWTRRPDHADELQLNRENSTYLPGLHLPANVAVSTNLADVVPGSSILVSAIPSRHVREIAEAILPEIAPEMIFVSATKGIETGTFQRMSQVLTEVFSNRFVPRVAVLSGPTFAREVASGEPAAVVIASETLGVAEAVQRAFATNTLRLYSSTDPAGVEVGAALKNVIAIGAGICSGLGLGSNSVAALITRGLAEITRLAVQMGGHARTLAGLAGLGDLVLTATGDLSRNRSVGIRLGQGEKLDEILESMTMIAEGVATCGAVRDLAVKCGVELPITSKMYEILYFGKDARTAVRELLDRPLTQE